MIILLNLFSIFLLTLFLLSVNNSKSTVLIVIVSWFSILFTYITINYWSRNRYFRNLEGLLNTLDKRYLIGEVMDKPYRLEDRIYRDILRKSNKSVIEKINEIEDEKKDYKEYIESWIHEIKLPITAMELICDNNKDNVTRRIQLELARVDNFVETVLFYARADEVYKDYIIKEINISEVIYEIIGRNKAYFIQNSMLINVDCNGVTAYSDKKWLAFIINQILINSVKYKKESTGTIKIYTDYIEKGVRLYIEDNGLGIKESEIKRVFQKGFTGSNGRQHGKSTGIGLYLCRKLSVKLGINISVESRIGQYTKVILTFPKGDYITKL